MTDEPVTPLVVQLRRIAQSIVDELIKRLHAAGYTDITAAHHPVFYNLDLLGTRLTELAARAGMTHQAMGESVSSLVELGYLERVPDPVDRRARLVVLTPKGRRAVRRARAEVADIDTRWVTRLHDVGVGPDIRDAFTKVLDQG